MLTRLVALRILLQSSDELVKVLLLLLSSLERAALQFGVVAHEEFFLGGGDVVDQCWASDAHDAAARGIC